jgi:ribosome-binding protein aMBF1 (putative translation factor)
MKECYRCGISEDNAEIFHAISSKGIVKICADCNKLEHLPVMKKPTEEQILQSRSPRSKSIQERLNAMRGGATQKRLANQDVTLRQIIDRKFQSQRQVSQQLPSDLIPNFHWEIQRIKRIKKMTREEFAKGIGESDATVRMIEQGFLPNNDYRIINKIESFLGISLRKQSSGFPDTSRRYILDNSLIAKEEKSLPPKKLSFNIESSKNPNVAEGKRIKEKYESEIPAYVKKESKKPEEKKEPVDTWEEEYAKDDEQYLDNPEEFYDYDKEDKG